VSSSALAQSSPHAAAAAEAAAAAAAAAVETAAESAVVEPSTLVKAEAAPAPPAPAAPAARRETVTARVPSSSDPSLRLTSPSARAAACQGLTPVHFSAQLERFVWDRGCA
jgi:hypothetical protein